MNSKLAEDMELLIEGQEKMLLNEYEEAEEIFLKESKTRDLRPLFGIMHGLLLAIRSISSLGRAHLKFSLLKFQGKILFSKSFIETEKLTHHQQDWTGRRIFKGVALACIGGIQMSQRSLLKGILTLSKSTKYLKAIQKSGLAYEGPERSIVRSGSLLCLGILQVMYSFLSDRKGKLAKWLSGFSGDKLKGMQNLQLCFEEKGLFAPWGAIAFILIQTDSNNLMGDEDLDAHLNISYEMLSWFQEKYEPSGLLTACEIAVAQVERNLQKVENLIVSRKSLFKLPGPKLVLLTKGGMLNLARMKFSQAGTCYKQAMDELMKVGQRGMVPYNATFAFLCFLQVLKEIKATERKSNEVYLQLQINTERSLSRLLRVFDWCMKKKNYSWGPSDKCFYSFILQYIEFDESRFENDIRMSIRTTLNRIKEALLLDYLSKLHDEKGDYEPLSKEDEFRYLLIKSELFIQLRQYDKALASLEPIASSKILSVYQMTAYYLRARIAFVHKRYEESRKYIKKIKSPSNNYFKYKEYLTYKTRYLLHSIDVEYSKVYDKIIVGKRSKVTYIIDLMSRANRDKIGRDLNWALVGDCFACKIEIYHKMDRKKRKKRVLEHIPKDTNLRNKVEGVMEIPKEGVLFINFDNHKNLLHTKSFYFRMEPKLNYRLKQETHES